MNDYLASLLSAAVYKNDKTGKPSLNVFNDRGFENITEVCVDEDYCVVANTADEIVVVVRGSDDWKDWVDNLEFFTDNDSTFGRVHKGFLHATGHLEERVFEHIERIKAQSPKICTKVWFIGHSKGGAVAELLCVKYAYLKTGCELYLTTFGKPKVGWSGYKKIAERKQISARCYAGKIDPVPSLPTMFVYLPSFMYRKTFTEVQIHCFHLIDEYILEMGKLFPNSL